MRFQLVMALCGGALVVSPLHAALVPVFPPIEHIQKLDAETDFQHEIGQAGFLGWQMDYKTDRPGYALHRMKTPLKLEPGTYRITFHLRRGHYPNKGLLNKAYSVFRLELWDLTENKLVTDRELQKIDFSSPNIYEKRWMEFTMEGREGHVLEPRVYWFGLANAEVSHIEIDRFPNVSEEHLEQKAHNLEKRLAERFLENGFVVSRNFDGRADEIGDATTYTGFYVAALSWKYAVTHDPFTYTALENAIHTLRSTIQGTDDSPFLTRFIDSNGIPFPKGPSKDVYTAFFLAYATAYPHIKNGDLKKKMQADLKNIGDRLLQDNLQVHSSFNSVLSLTPYFTKEEVLHGAESLLEDPEDYKKTIKTLKKLKRSVPVGDFWPVIKKIIKALNKKDLDELVSLAVPTMNDALVLLERVRDILREQYREDLFPLRKRNQDYPGKKLEILITQSLEKLPRKFYRLSDAKMLASNSLIVLHLMKTAEYVTGQPEFVDYYRNNLYQQDALLQSALDWYSLEEDFTKLTSGNPAADQLRKGYLSALSLYNLIQLETNPFIKEKYQIILDRWWKNYRHEDNPLAAALHAATAGNDGMKGLILKALDLYPENQTGFGNEYWKEQASNVANNLGGGIKKGYSREPLPVSHRPKDSFLWQRNSRRLSGDYLREYPGTDYLFVYWFCRYHNIIPTPPQQPLVQKLKIKSIKFKKNIND